jgi:quinoprotein glucose dehydrogenase
VWAVRVSPEVPVKIVVSCAVLFVVSKEMPALLKLTSPASDQTGGSGNGNFTSPFDYLLRNRNMSAIGPPWSQLTAYDLNRGTILWQIPNGDTAGLPKGLGSQGTRGGPLVTGGGLVFVGTPSDRKLRAYNTDTGAVLWEADVFGSPGGIPASYEIGGRQYIAFTVADGAGVGGMFAVREGPLPPTGAPQLRVYALSR